MNHIQKQTLLNVKNPKLDQKSPSELVLKSIDILNRLRHPSGLFLASHPEVSTGYNKAWIRDNVYEAMGLEAVNPLLALETYHALFDIFLKHEYKIDWAVKKKPTHAYQYIHARYNPETFEEFWEEWGNKQHDAIGLFLFKIGDLAKKRYKVIRDENDKRIIQKLINYLESIEYWHNPDNGIWEEQEEVHASSIGACVAGLLAVKGIVDVPQWIIWKGQEKLGKLLPYESETKEVDLALLSLIYPFNITNEKQTSEILRNIETKLLRKKGIIRYDNDEYYNNGKEAEWCFGLPWLAIIYRKLGDDKKHAEFLLKTLEAMTPEGELPELYYGGTEKYNKNTPLGWSQAMFLQAML